MKSDPWQGQLIDIIVTALNAGVSPQEMADKLAELAVDFRVDKTLVRERPSSGGNIGGEGAPSPTEAPSDGVAPDGAPPETSNESSSVYESRS